MKTAKGNVMRTACFIAFCLIIAAGSASADDMRGATERHPVIRENVLRAQLDCVVRDDGGLKACRIISVSPAGRSEAYKIVHRFESQVYLKPDQAKPGAHKRLTYVWTRDAA
jgi:hypothetical protein